MYFHILTLFPDMVNAGLHTSILGRAADAGRIHINTINFREYTQEKHGHVDDAPFGGGAGMVLQCQPIFDAWQAVCRQIQDRRQSESREYSRPRVLYTSPAGKVFRQEMARELAGEEDLVILCGHYEGVDQRILDLLEAEEVSIGDYVLTGGELPAMVMVDAISRMVPGVLTNEKSGQDESFSEIDPHSEFTRKERRRIYGDLLNAQGTESQKPLRLLEYPQYTRPEEFMGLRVPEILLSGDHAKVDAWRREQSLKRTRERRPDLLPS